MKVALLFEDEKFSNIDFSNVQYGNPGIGGTEYEIALLAIELRLQDICDVIVIHQNYTNCFPNYIESVVCHDSEIWNVVRTVDIFIYKSGRKKEWYKQLSNHKIKSICWAHNFLSYEELNSAYKCDYIKRIVLVGRQQYDHYFDHPAARKMTYVYNMVGSKYDEKIRLENFDNNVTYTGSLISLKGFHILAKYWKNIVQELPDAKLHVIGSGRLYSRGAVLGRYGIADDAYERSFMPYLLDEAGNILSSVIFHGVVGAEKKDIYMNTAVGIENPSADTETFGISGVEMLRMGIPVVTKAENGFLDTIPHARAGLLFDKEEQFPNYIIKLLKDHDFNKKLGSEGRKIALDSFSIECIINNWVNVLNEITSGVNAEILYPSNYLNKDKKKLRIHIHNCRKIPMLKWLPSLHTFDYFVLNCKAIVKKVLRRG